MKILILPVYYPVDYSWWKISIKRTPEGWVIWIGQWKRIYFLTKNGARK